MGKEVSKIKKMGIRSIHYSNNNVIIENSLSKNEEDLILYDVEYKNVEKLDKVIGEVKQNQKVKFNNLPHKGFDLSKKQEKVEVKNVKKTSFIQEIYPNITQSNNFDIQIYHNIEDIKKILSFYCNHVIFSLDSILNKESNKEISFKNFDNIGNLPSFIEFSNHTSIEKIFPILLSFANVYNIKPTNIDEKIDYFEIIKYVNKPEKTSELSSAWKCIVDYIAKKDENKKAFKRIYDKKINEIIEKFPPIKIKDFNFKNQESKEFFNKRIFLKEKEFLSPLKDLYSKLNQSYDYLRLFSSIRQYCVHDYDIKVEESSNVQLLKISEQQVLNFTKNFIKGNNKYLNILYECKKQFGADNFNQLVDEFYKYLSLDDGKNIGVSISKLSKIIKEKDENLKIENQKTRFKDNKTLISEFLVKYSCLLKFYLYKKFKNNANDLIGELKTCDDKEVIYNNIAKSVNILDLNQIKKAIINHLGKDNNNKKYEDKKFTLKKLNINNNSIKLLYVFSKLLSNKNANDLFARIITKIDSINDLIVLSKQANVTLSTYSDWLISIDKLDSIKEDLVLLKSIRAKDKVASGDFINYRKIVNVFNVETFDMNSLDEKLSMNKEGMISDKSREQKPLKQFLRNEVYKSKQYQTISMYADTRLCTKIMQNESIIAFVLNSLSKRIPEYLKRNYCAFLKVSNTNDSENKIINELTIALKNLTFENIVASIFDNTTKNYKAIVSLYLNVCYLIIKNIIQLNSLYFVAIREYDVLYKAIHSMEKYSKVKSFDFSINDRYLQYLLKTKRTHTKSYKQLISLKGKYENDSELNINKAIINSYRNCVEHLAILSEKDLWDKISKFKIDSYFKLYHILMQKVILNQNLIDKLSEEKKKKYNEEGYLQKIINICNIPYAYNVSRFNNLTIEKYFYKNELND